MGCQSSLLLTKITIHFCILAGYNYCVRLFVLISRQRWKNQLPTPRIKAMTLCEFVPVLHGFLHVEILHRCFEQLFPAHALDKRW